MIAHLSGQLTAKRDERAVIDVGGVGFDVTIPLSTYRALPREGETATLLTYLHVREDELRLFGFATSDERELFLLLNSVQGVGAKMAVDVLSHLPPERFVRAIEESDLALLCQVPGIGKKRAERLVFDLRRQESLKLLAAGLASAKGRAPSGSASAPAAEEALQAMIALGTKPAVASRAVDEVLEQEGEDISVEDLLRKALQQR